MLSLSKMYTSAATMRSLYILCLWPAHCIARATSLSALRALRVYYPVDYLHCIDTTGSNTYTPEIATIRIGPNWTNRVILIRSVLAQQQDYALTHVRLCAHHDGTARARVYVRRVKPRRSEENCQGWMLKTEDDSANIDTAMRDVDRRREKPLIEK